MSRQPHSQKVKRGGSGMALTSRDVEIIQEVAESGALTREQIRRHHKFGSIVRTNATLLRLARHDYLRRRFQPTLAGTRRAIYLIGSRGHELISATGGTEHNRFHQASDLFLQHRLMLNDVRFAFCDRIESDYKFALWKGEKELRRHPLPVLPDGYLEYALDGATFAAFIEADRGTEGPGKWLVKARGYVELAFSGLYTRLFGNRFFRVLVIAPTEERARAIARTVSKITTQIFWFTDLTALSESGPLNPIWVRADRPDKQSLREK